MILRRRGWRLRWLAFGRWNSLILRERIHGFEFIFEHVQGLQRIFNMRQLGSGTGRLRQSTGSCSRRRRSPEGFARTLASSRRAGGQLVPSLNGSWAHLVDQNLGFFLQFCYVPQRRGYEDNRVSDVASLAKGSFRDGVPSHVITAVDDLVSGRERWILVLVRPQFRIGLYRGRIRKM